MKHFIVYFSLTLGVLSLATIGNAQTKYTLSKTATVVPLTNSLSAQADSLVINKEVPSPDAIYEMVEQALPKWDAHLLEATSEADPVAKLSFDLLAEVVNDKLELLPPEAATQLDDGNVAIRLDAAIGKVRYLNRERSWNFKRDANTKAVDERRVQAQAEEILAKLGFPKAELQTPLVRTQMAGGARAGADKPEQLFEMYRLVIVQRRINEVPVLQSDVKFAVNNYGDVQRLAFEWPRFSVNPKAVIRSREEVVKEVTEEIADQDPDADLSLSARLVYAQRDAKQPYRPAVLVAVQSKPTPYQVLVPVSRDEDAE